MSRVQSPKSCNRQRSDYEQNTFNYLPAWLCGMRRDRRCAENRYWNRYDLRRYLRACRRLWPLHNESMNQKSNPMYSREITRAMLKEEQSLGEGKFCKLCQAYKPIAMFVKRGTKDRPVTINSCKDCHNAKYRKPKELGRGAYTRRAEEYRSNNGFKKCAYCEQIKHCSNYHRFRSSKDGLQYKCKDSHQLLAT